MRRLAVPVLLLLILIFAGLRFFQLDADPPIVLGQYGQSALTDPYLYTWHARQAALFPPDQRVEYERFSPLKFTAMSGAARLVFAVAGVSRSTANVASILLNLLGIILWLLALKVYWKWDKVLIVGLLLAANFIMLVYNRMPYLENGLVFLFGLTFLVHTRWHDRPFGHFATGLAIAASALCGKLFGLLLFVPVSAVYISEFRAHSIRPMARAVAGGLLGFIVFLVVALNADFQLWWQYHLDTVELLHISKYLFNPLGPIGMLLSFGGEGGLTLFGIGTVVIACVGTIVWLISRNFGALSREDAPLLFSVVWLALSLIVFLPFEYRPLRYQLVSILPALTLFIPIAEWAQTPIKLATRQFLFRLIPITVILLLLSSQIISYFANLAHRFLRFDEILPYCLIATGLVIVTLYFLSRKSSLRPHPWIGYVAACLVAGVYFYTNLCDIYGAYSTPRYDLKTLNREVAETIDPSAIVTGSYAPALTIDNRLSGIFNYLGTVRHDPAFFSEFHPTHILTNSTDWDALCEDYPQMKNFGSIVNPVLWSYHLAVVPMPDSNYHPTLFEQAVTEAQNRQLDSALRLLDTFGRLHPHNRFAATWRLNILFSANSENGVLLASVNDLLASHPDDLYISAFAAIAYDRLGRKDLSKNCLDNCNRINPFARPRLN